MLSNRFRFGIVVATQNDQLSITELSLKLKLSYNKCADYVRMLEQGGLIEKTKVGKEVKVKSRAHLSRSKIEFL